LAPKRKPVGRARTTGTSIQDSRWFVPVAFLILLVAVIFLFSDFVFSDQMLYGSDILSASLMFRIYKVDSMAKLGHVPQWIPHQFAGMPYVEAFHSDIYYPPTLAFNYARVWFDDNIQPIDVARDLGWLLILHIYISGIFMYRAARQFKLSRVAALVAGTCYMFSGYLVSFVAPGHDGKIYVAALFPLMMFFLARGFDTKPLKYFSLTGLTIGFILLTPHPQMSYFALWALSFYAAFRLIVLWVEKKSIIPAIKPGLFVTYAVFVGVAFSAIQMYPGILYTGEYSPRADTKKGWEWATSWSMHEEEAASLIIPEFSGTSSHKIEDTYYWGKNQFKDNSEWLGTVALMLGLLGLLYFRRRKEAWFFGGLTLFGILYGLGGTTPFFWIMFKLVPKVSSMRSAPMILFLSSFGLSMLAGMGIQAVMDAHKDRDFKLGRKFDYLLFGFPLFMLILALGFSVAGKTMLDIWSSLFYSEAATTMIQQNVSKLDAGYANLAAITPGAWLGFFFTALTAAFIWLYRQKKVGVGILIAIVAVIAVDGIRFDRRFVSLVDPASFSGRFDENGLTRFLAGQKEPMRVVNLLNPKDATLPVNGIDVLVGYHGNQLRWYDDLLGGPGLFNVPERNLLSQGVRANARFCNLAGATFMIDQTGGAYQVDHFGPIPLVTVADLGGAKLLRNDNAFPRQFLVDQYEVLEGEIIVGERGEDTIWMRKVVDEVLYGDTDLRKVVLLEENPVGNYTADSLSTDSAWIIDYEADSILIGLRLTAPRILVLTDTWFPSWHAYVDGRLTPILRADGAFRAVELPAGAQQVLFKYESDRFALGQTVTWVAFVYLLGIIGFSIYLERRPGLPKRKSGVEEKAGEEEKLEEEEDE
jgi:hypothetical protein